MSVEGAEDPVEARNPKRDAKAGAGASLADTAREIRLPQTGHERQPVRYPEFVFDELLNDSGVSCHAGGEVLVASVVEDVSEQLAVMLPETIQTHLQAVLWNGPTVTDLPSGIG